MAISSERAEVIVSIEEVTNELIQIMNVLYLGFQFLRTRKIVGQTRRALHYTMISKIPDQVKHLNRMIDIENSDCLNNLRMSRNTFGRLCYILENLGGLISSKNLSISEQVAIFLSVLAHHKKNRIVKFDFMRSGRTVSKYFAIVLNVVIRLNSTFIAQPTPVPEDSVCPRWKWFKGCLGALDGTYIPVKVNKSDKPRYRNRKGDIAINVLGVCDKDMKFIYVLTGWEGSAADGRVLRDAINRPNGLKVPRGNYYLADCGYTNGEGFLTPYRGTMYHIKDWENRATGPQTYQEYFNFRHASARNVIERTFGLLKMRWAILRSASYYPVKTHNRIIMACCLIHNFIRMEMPNDPLLHELSDDDRDVDEDVEYVETIQQSLAWTNWREDLAKEMFDAWI